MQGDEDEMQGLRTHDDTENGEMSSVDSITAKFQDLRRRYTNIVIIFFEFGKRMSYWEVTLFLPW